MTTQLWAWKYGESKELFIGYQSDIDEKWMRSLGNGYVWSEHRKSAITDLHKVKVVDEDAVVLDPKLFLKAQFQLGTTTENRKMIIFPAETADEIWKQLIPLTPPVQELKVQQLIENPDFETVTRSSSKGIRLIRKVANGNGNPNRYRIAVKDGWNPNCWSVYLEGAEKAGALFWGKWDSILEKYDVLPVEIQEPKNFGAVIRARCKHSLSDLPDVQDTYVRITDGRKFPWSGGDGTRHNWSDLINPVVKSLGIPND